jgi:succinyl-CoA synthetase beta subunit
MKIHEYQACRLFKESGLPTIDGEVAEDFPGARAIAEKIGYPIVLKSQVLVGGRGKAGGIKVVKSLDQLESTFKQLKALTIKGYPVEKIFVVRAINIQKEYYAAVTIDNANDDVVLIASSAGGVDIEETAKKHPEQIHKFYLRGQNVIDKTGWGEFISAVFPDQEAQKKGTEFFEKLVKVFFQHDCSLAEINPMVIDDKGQWYAADAKINLDDNALFRHESLISLRDMKYEDPDELEAKESGLSFVKLDGKVGCIVNGAGLAMATMDIVKLLGGEPANFLDVGGSSNPQKVVTALRIILRNKEVSAILINIFGGITRCDDIANGILEAKKQIEIPVPFVVRLTGTNEKEAKDILSKAGITTFSSMRDAVNEVVKLSK